ncbi:MAG: DUF3991 and toprim domain-containing protein [Acetobacteraceae bacterium]
MAGHDAELDQFRAGVSCAALLERLPPPWRLDKQESTRRALKYRRGAGEVLIINHDGRGWWDPQSAAKGDVFDLVQHLDPSLSFGQVRQVLRRFVGMSPSFPETLRARRPMEGNRSVAERWTAQPHLRQGSQAWEYLAAERRLTAEVLLAAADADVVRQGFKGGAWFAHRDEVGVVSHVESRGPAFKGSLSGGCKTLFRLAGSGPVCRIALAEAPIDALSLAAIEGIRPDTLYAATGGGMGPGTVQAIELTLVSIAKSPDAVLTSAADANRAGERYAERHAELAEAAGVVFERLSPPVGVDWNDTLRGRGA